MIGEHGGFKGTAVRYKQHLFKVLAQHLAGDDIDEGLGTTAIKRIQRLVQQHKTGGGSQLMREYGDGEGQAQCEGQLVGSTAGESRLVYVFTGSSVPYPQLEWAATDGRGTRTLGTHKWCPYILGTSKGGLYIFCAETN